MSKEKTTGFYFKMSPEESELFEQRMMQTSIQNKSAFIRKMCIDGHVFHLDIPELKEIGKLLRITANNINQIARRVNSSGDAYREDIAEVNNQLTEVRTYFGEVLALLSDIASTKPGKRYFPPPKIADYPEGA